MATFTFYDGNKGFQQRGFDLYTWDEEAETDSLSVLVFDESQGIPYDPAVFAYRIEIDLEGLVMYQITEGPYAGDERPIAGTATGIRFYDMAGNLLMQGTGLKGDVPTIATMMERGDNFRAMLVAMQGDNTFIGSNDSGAMDWDGDEITTGAGRDTVYANDGDDYIADRGGRDSYFGGDGVDQISYAEHWFWDDPVGAVVGLRVDLAAGTVRGPDKQVDTLSSIEQIRGTHLNDTMVGDDANNTFFGLAGNDRLDGGAGFDTVRYDRDDRYFGVDGILANLANGRVRDAFGFTDRVTNIEALRGTEQRDRIFDDNANNAFRGNGGNDYFSLSGGNDTVRGGADRDQFVFVGTSFGTDVIEDFSLADRDRIQILEADSMDDLTFLQQGSTGIVRLNANSQVLLLNFDVNTLDAADFIF